MLVFHHLRVRKTSQPKPHSPKIFSKYKTTDTNGNTLDQKQALDWMRPGLHIFIYGTVCRCQKRYNSFFYQFLLALNIDQLNYEFMPLEFFLKNIFPSSPLDMKPTFEVLARDKMDFFFQTIWEQKSVESDESWVN